MTDLQLAFLLDTVRQLLEGKQGEVRRNVLGLLPGDTEHAGVIADGIVAPIGELTREMRLQAEKLWRTS